MKVDLGRLCMGLGIILLGVGALFPGKTDDPGEGGKTDAVLPA